jgi:hypothetical protein
MPKGWRLAEDRGNETRRRRRRRRRRTQKHAPRKYMLKGKE